MSEELAARVTTQLQAENAQLRADNERLKAQLGKLENEIVELNRELLLSDSRAYRIADADGWRDATKEFPDPHTEVEIRTSARMRRHFTTEGKPIWVIEKRVRAWRPIAGEGGSDGE